jgi:hypothetical protein
MIDARDAAKAAADYYENISADRARLSIEEIEIDEDNGFWLITLGIADAFGIGMNNRSKEYKIFKIDAESGEVKSMKILQV